MNKSETKLTEINLDFFLIFQEQNIHKVNYKRNNCNLKDLQHG